MGKVIEFLWNKPQGPAYPTQSIQWLLIAWKRKEPGYRQTLIHLVYREYPALAPGQLRAPSTVKYTISTGVNRRDFHRKIWLVFEQLVSS